MLKIKKLEFNHKNGILIQSMTNTKTNNIKATLDQIKRLTNAGADLVRVAIFDEKDINALSEIVKKASCPIVADIHFNYKFAIKAITSGVAKIRLNPGNINSEKEIKEIIDIAKKYKTIIRIGVNCGSLPLDLMEKYDNNIKIVMIESLRRYLKIFEKHDFKNIVISLKSSNPFLNVEVNKLAFKIFPYPIHLGVTEAGSLLNSTIKSTLGIAPLLQTGIGDTIRISISDDPVKEIQVAKKLLNILGIRKNYVEIIACPTCGRLDFDLFKVVEEIEDFSKKMTFPLRISILGCVVNGIGEAKESDIGIAGSSNKCLLFENGKILRTISSSIVVDELKKLILKKEKEYFDFNS